MDVTEPQGSTLQFPDAPDGRPATAVTVQATAPVSWWGIALVLALTFAAYAPTLRYGFVHDDRGQIVENPAVHSWSALPSYFTAQVWAAVMPEEQGNYYRPLFLTWLRINDALFGHRAWGWHLSTILVHLVATLLLYLLVCRLDLGRGAALLAALIFGLHPAHIEGVAWISGVTEPLLAVLWLASLLAYMQWRTHGLGRWRVVSLALFALALIEKETALILPILLLVYDWIFRSEGEERFQLGAAVAWLQKALGRIWPYFVVIGLYVPARIHALKGFSHAVTALSPAQLVFTWPSLILFWIRHLAWPAGLSTFYDFPAVLRPTLTNFALPAVVDALLGLALVAAVRKSRAAAFFAIWLVLPLIPVLDIRVFIANDFAHDRYLYLPSAGLAVLLALLLSKVCVGPPRWLGMPASLLVVRLGLGVVMGTGVVTQTFYFRDNLTFYRHNLQRAPHNPDAGSNYATVLAEAGNYGPALDKYLEVVRDYPAYWTPTYNLALTYYKTGQLPQAEEYFLRAIQLRPGNPDQFFYLGMARFKAGRTAEAMAAARQAILIRPNGYAYHFALAMMLKTEGDLNGALGELRQELANHPEEQGTEAQIREIENTLAAPPTTSR